MINAKQAKQHYLERARAGAFGTPDNRNRGSTDRDVFWKCFDGVHPSTYRNWICYGAALAGAAYRSELGDQS